MRYFQKHWLRLFSQFSAAVLALVLTNSCTIEAPFFQPKKGKVEVTLSPEEARLEMMEVFDNAQKLSNEQWTLEVSPLPYPCDVLEDSDGVFFTANTLRPLGSEPLKEQLQKVIDQWQAAGLEVKSNAIGYDAYSVSGFAESGLEIYFTINTRADYSTDSACVLGDLPALTHEYAKRFGITLETIHP